MMRILRILGSNKAAFLGMVILAVAVLVNNRMAAAPVWLLVGALGFLAVALLAAMVAYPRIHRQPGLLGFHLALLAIAVLAALGRLTQMQAHFEIAEGQSFNQGLLQGVRKGPLHTNPMASVSFVQGPVSVQYAPGIKRGATNSQVLVPGETGGLTGVSVGDDRPLIIDGYRIYSTHRKGFAPVLTWQSDNGVVQTGTVHMPSYPLFLYQQENDWMPPGGGGGEPLHLSLDLETTMDDQSAWVLAGNSARAALLVEQGGITSRLEAGESLQLGGGTLRYERLVMWKGYNVFYDPTLAWMFASAVAGVLAFVWHLWGKFRAQNQQQHQAGVGYVAGVRHPAAGIRA